MEAQNPLLQFWQRAWWSKLVIIVSALFFLLIVIGIFTPSGQKSFKEGAEEGKKLDSEVSSSPQLSPSEVPTPKPSSQPSPIPKPVSFDLDLGNNQVAANFAKDFFGIANKAAPGYITSVRVDLTPEDLGGKSEDDYKKNLISVYLTVEVDSHLWNTTGEAGQKDLAASFLTSISNTFGGIPHVKITNGVRTVAEAEYPLFGGDPKIILK